jgi:hypothetical protein
MIAEGLTVRLTHIVARQLLVRGLIDRHGAGSYVLTEQGRRCSKTLLMKAANDHIPNTEGRKAGCLQRQASEEMDMKSIAVSRGTPPMGDILRYLGKLLFSFRGRVPRVMNRDEGNRG